MALPRGFAMRWWLIFLCLVLGTWAGVFLQRFELTAPLFFNAVDFTVDIREIDLSVIRFGFLFAVKANLGTLLGGLFGVFVIK